MYKRRVLDFGMILLLEQFSNIYYNYFVHI